MSKTNRHESGEPRDASPATWALRKRWAASWVFRKSPVARRMAMHLGELADYNSWLLANFGDVPMYSTREALWEKVAPQLRDDDLTVLEFGVAWGYATNWWLQRLRAPSLRWYGFDTFTGLPARYREMDAGTFSADGATPDIDDERVTWIAGLAEDTVPDFAFDPEPAGQMFLFFDFDLYEPSLVAWSRFAPLLKRGDILYFDEPWDQNERRLIDQHVLPHHQVRAIGATTQTLALEYLGPRRPEDRSPTY